MLFPTSDAMGMDLSRRFFNAADRTKMLRKRKELEALAAKDKAFLANEEQPTGDTGYYSSLVPIEDQLPEAPGGSFAEGAGDASYEGSGGSFAESEPQISKEDLDWFKKETGTAFNSNSVADVYYLMNRKYNKVSEAKADELERKRKKESAATNVSRVQKMKGLMR